MNKSIKKKKSHLSGNFRLVSGFLGEVKICLLTGLLSPSRGLVERVAVFLSGVLVEKSVSGFGDSEAIDGFFEAFSIELILERERERVDREVRR